MDKPIQQLIDKVKETYQVSLIMKFILKVWKRPIMRHMINLLIKRILIIYIKLTQNIKYLFYEKR